MLRSHNVLTKGTDSDSVPQQSLVMQRDGNLYPLFSVTITFQFSSHRSDSDNLLHVCFNKRHVQLSQHILVKIKINVRVFYFIRRFLQKYYF
jgi:hypothetical protein